ncbi:MAG: DinB family protein [Caldilineales bacterium]
MSQGQTIANTFGANLWIIRRQADGLTHADSLLQPTFRANCLNWVLGHIVVGRNRALKLLELEQVWGDDERLVYETGSTPLLDEANAVPLERLLALLDLAQDRLAEKLNTSSDAVLREQVHFRGRDQTLGEALAGLAWHETYHTGQTELLRQLSGVDDKVI